MVIIPNIFSFVNNLFFIFYFLFIFIFIVNLDSILSSTLSLNIILYNLLKNHSAKENDSAILFISEQCVIDFWINAVHDTPLPLLLFGILPSYLLKVNLFRITSLPSPPPDRKSNKLQSANALDYFLFFTSIFSHQKKRSQHAFA